MEVLYIFLVETTSRWTCGLFSYFCGIGRGMRALLKGTAAMPSIMLVALVAWSMICGLAVQAQDDFDFFYFVQQWPGSYCDTRRGCCFPLSSNPKAVFGIHGLWPNYDDGSWPDFCTKEPFNPKELADVVDQMDDDWGSLACPASDSHSFWTHEWTKHGTCSGLGQHGYFQSAIDLYGKHDITGALAKAGILPDGKHYQVDAIRHAISTVLDGHLPGIDCNKDGHGNRQLYQVYICVGKDGKTLIECPIFPRNECKGSVEFPVFDPHHHRLNSGGANDTGMRSDH